MLLKNIAILIFIISGKACFAQKIYMVKYESQADIKIHVVKNESQCDLKVGKVWIPSKKGRALVPGKIRISSGPQDIFCEIWVPSRFKNILRWASIASRMEKQMQIGYLSSSMVEGALKLKHKALMFHKINSRLMSYILDTFPNR